MIPWRMLALGTAGAVLAVLACAVWPLTVVEASLAGGGLAVAGLAAGAVLDVRAALR